MSERIRLSRSAKSTALVKLSQVFEDENKKEEQEDVQMVEHTDNEETFQEEQKLPAIIGPLSEPLIAAFKTDAKLGEGLSIIRSLGGGNYEIVNLKSAESVAFGSEKFGEKLRNSPGLKSLFEAAKENAKDSKNKVYQAVRAANGTIFRFLKLPIELRFRIYEMCVLSPKMLLPKAQWGLQSGPLSTLTLRATCQQIYVESLRFFWKNNFKIIHFPKTIDLTLAAFLDNVKEITLNYFGNSRRDAHTFFLLRKCTNLKILNIMYLGYRLPRRQRQRLHQDNDSIKFFRSASGFDHLAQIRGLQRVTVTGDQYWLNRGIQECTKRELDDFQTFLNAELTKPKSEEVEQQLREVNSVEEMRKALTKKAKKVKKAKRSRMDSNSEDDFNL